MSKLVNCIDCKKEIKFSDANPYWTSINKEPDFICKECAKNIPKATDKQLINFMTKNLNQPERLNPEASKEDVIV